MSGGLACRCPAEVRRRPPKDRPWFVYKYMHNNSHFHGGYQSSVYSAVHCTECGRVWRTRARYVDELPLGDLNDSPYWRRNG